MNLINIENQNGIKLNAPKTDAEQPLSKLLRDRSLREKSNELEALFITQMFKAMEKTIPDGALTGSKNSLSSMMFSSVLGDAVADQGGIGLSDVIYHSLKEADEIPNLEKLKTHDFLKYVQDTQFLGSTQD